MGAGCTGKRSRVVGCEKEERQRGGGRVCKGREAAWKGVQRKRGRVVGCAKEEREGGRVCKGRRQRVLK
jgi:hypothetical protein